jgi:photosynthetic reaction center cytochrome c subunit
MEKQIVRVFSVAAQRMTFLFFATTLLFPWAAAAQTTPLELRENQTAENVFKNIQALKGMRAGDLQGAMSFIASSLNVDCDYCHEQDFSKDEKKEKLRAREMIRMVRQINEGSFQGKNTGNWFTSPQGHAEPIALAPIVPPPPRAPKAEAATVEKPAGTPLPSVAEVLDHYVQALGGQAALDEVKSRIIKTTRLNGGNPESITMIYQKGPGKVLLARESPSYSLWVGFDGTRAWAQDSLKSYWGLLNTPQRNAILRDSEIYQGSRIRSQYSDVKVARAEKIGEENAYVVSGMSPERTSEEFYFDVQTGLLLRRHIEEQTIFGGFQIRADFEDYRDIGGVQTPFVVRWSSPGGAWGTRTSFKVLEVQQNQPISDEKFEGPPAK